MKRYTVVFALVALASSGAAFRPRAAHASASPRVIEVHAKRFGFAPNVITVKKGESVKIHLVSEDVTHGFFSKPLKLDEVVAPNEPVDITVATTTPGKYTVICDHFCGAGHGAMGMTVVVEE